MTSPERLEQLLGARPLAQLAPGLSAWRAIIDPIDVAPVRIDLVMDHAAPTLEFSVLAAPVSTRAPSPPRWTDRFAVPHATITAFEGEVARGTAAWRAGPRGGADSVYCRAELRGRGALAPRVFEAFNPQRGDPAQGVFAAFHRMTAAVADTERSRRALDRLWAPLDLGVPASLQGTEPKILRIFGPLRSRNQGDLRNLLASLDPRESLVVQMVDCPAIESAVFGDLQRLARRPGPTAFAATLELRDQLMAAGVPGSAIVADPATLQALFGER